MDTKHLRFVTIFILSTLLLPGFGYAANVPPNVEQLVANAKKSIKTIKMDEFKKMHDKMEFDLIVDVRDPDEYVTGYIPGAINVSRGKLEFGIWQHVGGTTSPKLNTKMALYCGSGSRCALAAKSLKDLGFSNVVAVDMTLADWKKAGYPLQK